MIDGKTLPDLHVYDIAQDLWLDDITMRPNLEFGDLYTYQIDTKGYFTKDKRNAYKSLQAYTTSIMDTYIECITVRAAQNNWLS